MEGEIRLEEEEEENVEGEATEDSVKGELWRQVGGYEGNVRVCETTGPAKGAGGRRRGA